MTSATTPRYSIVKANKLPEMNGAWENPAWQPVTALEVANFRPEGSNHRPDTKCKLQYNSQGIFGIFKVQDRYVRCTNTGFQSDVFKDSCVEIFLEPKPGVGYFNFEFNCGGSLLAYHIKDPIKTNGGFKDYTRLTPEDDDEIKRFHSAPEMVDPETSYALTWQLEFFIPFALFEKYIGPLGENNEWRGNLYKCGDDTSHPHWAAWSAVEELNFHAPQNFGQLIFDH